MLPQDPERYPFQKTRDARGAMGGALASLLGELEWSYPATATPERMPTEAIHDSWADFEKRALSENGMVPAAAVLPDKLTEEESDLGPRYLDDTWTTDGTGGRVLVALGEWVGTFLVVVRGKSRAQRDAILGAAEDLFIELPTATSSGTRLGRLVEVESYYRRKARFSLGGIQLLDSAETVKRNRWLAQLEVTGRMQHCVVRTAPALSPRFRGVVDEVEGGR